MAKTLVLALSLILARALCGKSFDQGAIPDLPLLEIRAVTGSVCTVGLARVPASDTPSDLCRWTKACQAPKVGLSDLRRACYRSDKGPQGVDTDSMALARSTEANCRTRFSMIPPPEDADDKRAEEGHVRHMEQLAKQYKEQWPEEGTEEVGMSSLRNLSRRNSENVPKQTEAGSSTQNPYGNLAKSEDRHSAHRQQLQGRQKDPGDNGSEGAHLPFPAPKSADPNVLMMMAMRNQMRKRDKHDENTGGKAFHRVHAIRLRCEEQPEQVVSTYLDEVTDRIGAEPGDLWQPWMMTKQVH